LDVNGIQKASILFRDFCAADMRVFQGAAHCRKIVD
jgi:hypothetical protein